MAIHTGSPLSHKPPSRQTRCFPPKQPMGHRQVAADVQMRKPRTPRPANAP